MSFPAVLEKLILNGLAEYDTWSFGTAGAGTLRLQKETFIIVTDFDYFYFVDEPIGVEANPATSYSNLNVTDDAAIAVITYEISGLGVTGDISLDPSDPEASCDAFEEAIMDTFGFFSVCTYTETNIWDFFVVTDAPGTAYNGIIPTIDVTVTGERVLTPGAFSGGTDQVPATPEQINDNSVHQLEFRQKGKKYSWIIRENLQLFPRTDGAPGYGNVNGVFQKRGLYIPFTENIQIGIEKVPPVSEWSITYQTLTNKANEPLAPAGYGIGGTPQAGSVVWEVLFDAAAEQYLPLTEDRNDTTLSGDYREQFKVNYTASRALENPIGPSGNDGAYHRYPIISIGYVRVNMKWEEFQKQLEQWTKK